MFESCDAYVKFKVLNNRDESKTVEFVTSGYIEDDLAFIAIR